ncbi:hypothetical protein ACWCPM_11210 [Streptomyces sp. NPDC002309]
MHGVAEHPDSPESESERNWYLPRWWDRLPDLTHDESADAVAGGTAMEKEAERVRV